MSFGRCLESICLNRTMSKFARTFESFSSSAEFNETIGWILSFLLISGLPVGSYLKGAEQK